MTPDAADPGRGHWRNRHLLAGIALITGGIVLLTAIIAGSYFMTIWTARRTVEQQQAATVKGALRECTALQGLAAIKGSHIPSATYGYHLQAGIANVYRSSGCPELLAKYGPRP